MLIEHYEVFLYPVTNARDSVNRPLRDACTYNLEYERTATEVNTSTADAITSFNFQFLFEDIII